jgi:phage terminase large subunit-like protein
MASPNELDSMVWAITDLLLGDEPKRAGAFGR